MDKILEAAAKLVAAAKGNLVGTLLVIILLALVFGGANLMTKVANIAEHFPTSAVESERFNKVLIAQNEINELLETERAAMQGDRILIRQFHNGRQDLTGLPFTSISTTFVRTKPGVQFDSSNYEAVPLSTMNEVVLRMWKNPREPICIRVETSDLHGQYADYVKKTKVDHFYACPITNLQGWPVGMTIISYLDKNSPHPSDDFIMKRLLGISQKVSGYMLSVTKHEKTAWIFPK